MPVCAIPHLMMAGPYMMALAHRVNVQRLLAQFKFQEIKPDMDGRSTLQSDIVFMPEATSHVGR